MNHLELDQMLKAYTHHEITALKRANSKETKSYRTMEYSLLKKVNEFEYLVESPKDHITIAKQTRFIPIPKHRHDVIELAYMYSGQSIHTINDERFVLSKGEVCILDTNVVHSVETTSEDDILINILMSKEYFDTALLSRLPSHEALSNFLVRAVYQGKEYNDYIIFHSKDNANIHDLMINLRREYYDKTLGSEEAIKCYIVLIFLELLRVYDIQTAKKNMPKKAIITEILKFIDSNYHEVTLSSLAQQFNFHPNYLSAFLKKMTSHNFKDIVQKKRMNHAYIMLSNTDMDIESIAKESGFTNLSFFYKKFKQAYGTSPGEYRASIGSK